MVRENDLELKGLSCGSSEVGVPGMMRTVLSHSGGRFLVLKLRCGSRFLVDGLPFAENGFGGKPALVALGLVIEGIFILVELGHGFSMDLEGICNEERFGRLGSGTDGISPSCSVCLQACGSVESDVDSSRVCDSAPELSMDLERRSGFIRNLEQKS